MAPPTRKLKLFSFTRDMGTAFKVDCEFCILDHIRTNTTVSFQQFLDLWKTNKFHLIFRNMGHQFVMEQLLESFYTIVKYYLTDSNRNVKSASLYLLYAIYYQQPIRNWWRIRLTLQEYKALEEISRYSIENRYLFCKLLANEAIQFVAIKLPVNCAGLNIKRPDFGVVRLATLRKTSDLVENVKRLQNLKRTLNEYDEMENEYKQLFRVLPQNNEDSSMVFNFPTESTLKEDLERILPELKQTTNEPGRMNE